MKVLHTSDWHLGKKIEGRDRRDEQQSAIQEIAFIADKENVDAVFVCGDIFDTFLPPASAEDLFYSAINELAQGGRRLVAVIAGNHDDPARLCAASALAGRQSIILSGGGESDYLSLRSKRFSPVDSGEGFIEIQSDSGRMVLSMLAYPSDARLKKLDADIAYSERINGYLSRGQSRFSKDKLNFNLTHLFASGASAVGEEREIQVGGLNICTLNVFSPLSTYVALGHIHSRQVLRENIQYSGALLKYSVSDRAQKGVVIVDAKPGMAATTEFIPFSAVRDVVRLDVVTGEEAIEVASKTGAYVYLNFVRSSPLALSEYKALNSLKNVVGISMEPAAGQNPDAAPAISRRELRPLELFTEYYKSLYGGENPDGELIKLFSSLMEQSEVQP